MSEKKFFLGFNWKMNPSNIVDSQNLFASYKIPLESNKNCEIVVFPPSIYLVAGEIFRISRKIKCGLGAQDLSAADEGPYTGQISAKMLLDTEVKYSIIGHSETRDHYGLTNREVNEKVKTALKNGISPVLCIGFQRDPGQTEINYMELKTQIQAGLRQVKKIKLELHTKIIIAYEPVWAIGTGKTADSETISTVHKFIKEVLISTLGVRKAEKIQVIYGGSVNDTNALELSKIEGVDGFLIGGASLSPEKFAKIVNDLNAI
ncbi:MAG: triose-phosphate isomerase [bacterium]